MLRGMHARLGKFRLSRDFPDQAAKGHLSRTSLSTARNNATIVMNSELSDPQPGFRSKFAQT